MLFDEVNGSLKEEVESLKRQLDIDSESLEYKWQAWIVKNERPQQKLDERAFVEFSTDLMSSYSRPKKKLRLNTPSTGRSLVKKAPPSPKTHHKHTTQLSSDLPSSPQYDVYNSRNDSGEIVAKSGDISVDIGETELTVPGAEGYKNMHVKVAESTALIDQRIEWFLQQIQDHYNFTDDELCNPALTTQQDSWAVGRIIGDKRLSNDSIYLQTCRRFGAGTYVPLDVDQLDTFSFFPGQLVAFRGTNPNGEKFVIKQQFMLPEPQLTTENKDTSAIIAAGPFTTRDNLNYGPLEDLVKVANEEMPSVVILMGPFVDPSHPLIISGDVGNADTLSDVFALRVSPILAKIKAPTVLIPGMHDDVGGHVPFPQPSLAKKRLRIPQECRCAGNPASFTVNGTKIVCTSIDPIQDIMRSKYERELPSTSRPFVHLLDQRSLYPVFPSPRPQVSIDLAHLDRAYLEEDLPQVLIAGSTIKPVIEDIYGVLCINPGLLSKQTAAGTYAKLRLGAGTGPVTDRYQVEIVKI